MARRNDEKVYRVLMRFEDRDVRAGSEPFRADRTVAMVIVRSGKVDSISVDPALTDHEEQIKTGLKTYFENLKGEHNEKELEV